MKKPKLIYTYWQTRDDSCGVICYELRIYKPSYFNEDPKYFFSLGSGLFDITAQSNIADDRHHPMKNNIRGLCDAYGIRITNLDTAREDAFDLARKLCRNTISMKCIIKRLRKLGAVRYALGQVDDPKSWNGKEWMPRKFVGKKSAAYWSAICSGIEVAL